MDLMGPIAGMYRLIDMSHTTVNVSGDVLGTVLDCKMKIFGLVKILIKL